MKEEDWRDRRANDYRNSNHIRRRRSKRTSVGEAKWAVLKVKIMSTGGLGIMQFMQPMGV